MDTIERLIIDLILNFVSREELNLFLRDPRNTAIIVGGLIAVCGALLGTFLLLRGMSLTSDAISHTVLLGIVVAFLLMTRVFNMEPDLSSPFLIIGAAAAGVLTVFLTEMIYRSGLVRQDAALGLAFPLLFAVAVILVARYADNAHLDQDAVMVGEIGIAWANTSSVCYDNCESVTITPDDPRAEVQRSCINCRSESISPRDARAEFAESCGNCGTYTPAQAWREGLIENEPLLVFFPKSITVMGIMTLFTVLFVTLFYKELKLSTFDSALAQALGFRPGWLSYGLMVMVSLVAVGAFDAVGSILVVAFFIIPPATAYLLTDRLWQLLILSPIMGGLSVYLGFDLARGDFLGVFQVSDLLATLNRAFSLDLPTTWDSSISASMVLMMFFIFVVAWVFSPKYGMISTLFNRSEQRRRFADQVMMGHIYNHQGTEVEAHELAVDTLNTHFAWTRTRTQRVLLRLRALNFVQLKDDHVVLTERGRRQVETFKKQTFVTEQ
ncbi:MAG: metal ABC transporter permease [Aggregatilineales bacterium]